MARMTKEALKKQFELQQAAKKQAMLDIAKEEKGAQGAQDTQDSAQATVSRKAYSSAALQAMHNAGPFGIATETMNNEIEYLTLKSITIIPAATGKLQDTDTAKEKEKTDKKTSAKKATVAEAFLSHHQIEHSELIKSDAELWKALENGGKCIVVLVQQANELSDITYNQAWKIQYLFNPDGTWDKNSIRFTWLHESHIAGKNSDRVFAPSNLHYDGFNWKLVHQKPVFRSVTVYKA